MIATEKLAQRVALLEKRLERLQSEQRAHGETFIPEAELGGVRSVSQRRKEQRMERTIRLAVDIGRVAADLRYQRARLAETHTPRVPSAPRKPRKARDVDRPRQIEQCLSSYGRHTLSSGAVLSLWMGWDFLNRDVVGSVLLEYPGRSCRRFIPDIQLGALYALAVGMAREHLATVRGGDAD